MSVICLHAYACGAPFNRSINFIKDKKLLKSILIKMVNKLIMKNNFENDVFNILKFYIRQIKFILYFFINIIFYSLISALKLHKHLLI